MAVRSWDVPWDLWDSSGKGLEVCDRALAKNRNLASCVGDAGLLDGQVPAITGHL